MVSCALLMMLSGCKEKNQPVSPSPSTAGGVSDPQWVVTVDNDMSSSMTAVVRVTIDDKDGTLAAFIGDDCCGVATALENGLYMLYISPSESGNTIRFQFYSPAQKHIYASNETLTYTTDGHEGTFAQPYTPTWIVSQ